MEKKLSEKGLWASAEARSYGRTDSCGTYLQHGVDFTVTLPGVTFKSQSDQQTVADVILPVLKEFGKPDPGNVKLVDIQKPYFGARAGLLARDFQATAGRSAVSTPSSSPVNNWYSATIDGTGYIYINLTATTQFRLRFTLDDNNNKREDSVKFYSGDGTTANRPQLIIQYSLP